jgi:hypothetical protein
VAEPVAEEHTEVAGCNSAEPVVALQPVEAEQTDFVAVRKAGYWELAGFVGFDRQTYYFKKL